MWVVLGGAGYVGSHVAHAMEQVGLPAVVVDDLSRGLDRRVSTGTPLHRLDGTDRMAMAKLFSDLSPDGVVLLAGRKHARESVDRAAEYWHVNVGVVEAVVSACAFSGVKRVIFSSSCSIFGGAKRATEHSRLDPKSPYAWSKVAAERLLTQAAEILELRVVLLRYFNAVGAGDFTASADTSGECLLPSISRSLLTGEALRIWGNDFATPDGTALRDYVDVRDLAQAHLAAIRFTETMRDGSVEDFNLGRGCPTSVMEIVELVRDAGYGLKTEFGQRNPADPAEVWADVRKARSALGWSPHYSLEDAIASHMKSVRMREGSPRA